MTQWDPPRPPKIGPRHTELKSESIHTYTRSRWSFLSSKTKNTARGSNRFCDTNFLRRVRHLVAEQFLRACLHTARLNIEALVLKANSDAGFNPACSREVKTEAITVQQDEKKKKQQLVK